jgi:hypothetical protein
LRNQPDRRAQLTWDDRLGVMAVSFGLEMTVLSTISFVLSAFAIWLQLGPLLLIACFIAFTTMMLAATASYFSQGGPAFAIAGISVRAGRSRASKMRCLLRSCIAWTPALISYSFIAVSSSTQVIQNSVMSPDSHFNLLFLVMVGGLLLLIHFLGAFISVLSPERGVQDWLAGTHLVPR